MFKPTRSLSRTPPVAVEAETPIQSYVALTGEQNKIERRLGTTRAHRSRALNRVIC